MRLVPSHWSGHGWDPTTRAMLLALQQLDLNGKTVLDFGAGVGTLALAALALGATYADAVDNYPDALSALHANCRFNHAEGRMGIHENLPDNKYDIVLCTVFAPELILKFLPQLINAMVRGGKLILTCRQPGLAAVRDVLTIHNLFGQWRHISGDIHGCWAIGEFHAVDT